MTSTSIEYTRSPAPRPGAAFLPGAPAAARAVLGMLPRLQQGLLELQLPDGSRMSFGQGAPGASLRIAHWNVFRRILGSGDIGFAEGYIAGEWDTPDLTALLTLFVANRDELQSRRLRHLVGLAAVPGETRAEPQFTPRQREEHSRPLRPRQCVLRAVARPLDELLQRLVRGRPHALVGCGTAREGAARPRASRCGQLARACSRSAAAGGAWRKWQRATSAPTSPASRCRANSSTVRTGASPRPAWPRVANCAFRTIATSQRDTKPNRSTPSSRSKCSRPSGANTGTATSTL